MILASVGSVSNKYDNGGGASPRGIQTKSNGGSSCCLSRNASRNIRFQRFRTTELPTFRETVKPSRGSSKSFSAP
jgi:hypothetical protein